LSPDAIRAYRLPNMGTLLLFTSGLIYAWWFKAGDFTYHLIGAVAGLAVFFLISTLYSRLRGRAGLGMGDAKMLGSIGAWVGVLALPHVIFLASLSGLIWGGVMLIKGRGSVRGYWKRTPFPHRLRPPPRPFQLAHLVR